MLSTGISALQKIFFFFSHQTLRNSKGKAYLYLCGNELFNNKSKGCEIPSWCETPEVKQIIEVIFVTF